MLSTASPRFSWLMLRARGPFGVAVFLTVSVVAAVFATTDLVGVPMAWNRAIAQLVWLSCLPAVAAASLLAPPDDEWERSVPRRLIGPRRVAGALLVAAVPPLLHGITVLAGMVDAWGWCWFTRNHLWMWALTVVVSRWLAPALSWAPASVYALLCWYVGTSDMVATPHWWAVVNHRPHEWPAWVATGMLAAMAILFQWARPSRSGA